LLMRFSQRRRCDSTQDNGGSPKELKATAFICGMTSHV
jgi:hypothetical protein